MPSTRGGNCSRDCASCGWKLNRNSIVLYSSFWTSSDGAQIAQVIQRTSKVDRGCHSVAANNDGGRSDSDTSSATHVIDNHYWPMARDEPHVPHMVQSSCTVQFGLMTALAHVHFWMPPCGVDQSTLCYITRGIGVLTRWTDGVKHGVHTER